MNTQFLILLIINNLFLVIIGLLLVQILQQIKSGTKVTVKDILKGKISKFTDD